MTTERPTRWIHKKLVTNDLPSESELDGLSEAGWQLLTVMREGGVYHSFLRRQVGEPRPEIR